MVYHYQFAAMILFNREVLFVHNPKTAGTSLLGFLERALPNVTRAGVAELGTHHPHLDMALGYACAKTGNRPRDFKRVLVGSRDPIARERSMYAYFRKLHGIPSVVRELNDDRLLRCVTYAATRNADDYITAVAAMCGHCDVWFSRYYYRGGTFERSRLNILRVSHLADDLFQALDGIDHKPTDLSVENVTNSGDIEFAPRSLEIIGNSYAWMERDSIPV